MLRHIAGFKEIAWGYHSWLANDISELVYNKIFEVEDKIKEGLYKR